MSDHAINISLSPDTVGYAEGTWIRIAQEKPPEDTATIGEVAAVIDSFYKTSPCGEDPPVTDAQNPDGSTTPPVTEEEVNETLASLLPANQCLFNAQGHYECTIDVFRSDVTKPYKLVVVDGEVNETVKIQKKILLRLKVKDSSYIDLKYPVLGGFTVKWVGTAKDRDGTRVTPDIELKGSVLVFDKYYSGTISASFLTEYDAVNVLVKGQTDQKESVKVLAFYEGLVEELDTEVPEVDERYEANCIGGTSGGTVTCTGDHTCYQVEHHYSRCQCGGEIADTYTTEPVEIPCPPDWCFGGGGLRTKEVFDGYVDCNTAYGDDAYDSAHGSDDVKYWVNDQDYYEEKCCVSPPFALPRCERVYSSYAGDPGAFDLDFYLGLYGPRTQFAAVYPDGPEGCGSLEIRQVVQAKNCCDVVPPIIYDVDNSVDVLSQNSAGLIIVTGGQLPLKVQIRGAGFFLDSSRTIRDAVISSRVFYVYTSAEACGYANLYISDGCTYVYGHLKSTQGAWVLLPLEQWGEVPQITPDHLFVSTQAVGEWHINGITGYGGKYRVDQYYQEVVAISSTEKSWSTGCPGTCYYINRTVADLIAANEADLLQPDYSFMDPVDIADAGLFDYWVKSGGFQCDTYQVGIHSVQEWCCYRETRSYCRNAVGTMGIFSKDQEKLPIVYKWSC